ncbi:hypothetical protein SERLA73DRAFT_68928 [Serpula lacrymans var. lacrymans S7.3]|uniref:F-box domain-containing protein n=1 Tax=Serpula lacrymans var. lacrymans (strain S7.3) TaxID=936435 RepID=F8PFL1_SERL3|nr:hypothetical protein SERLA73DRAFT_68928 [Serpula lacrymans var. lacrymans S7.3]
MAPAREKVKRPSAAQKGKETVVQKSWITDMPLDVLFEIFKYVEPLTLSNLTRTSKGFRALLLNRSKACRVWQDVLAGVEGLPPASQYYLSVATSHRLTVLSLVLSGNMSKDLNLNMCSFHTAQFGDATPRTVQCFTQKKGELVGDFFRQRIFLTSTIGNHARLCAYWEERLTRIRESEIRRLIYKRRVEIEHRLTKTGWGGELSYIKGDYGSEFTFSLLPEVNKAEKLDNRKWRNIHPKLFDYMMKHSLSRMKEPQESALRARFIKLDTLIKDAPRDIELDFYPRLIDICQFPKVQQLLDVGYRVEVDCEHLQKELKLILPGLMEEWHEDVMEEFEDHLRSNFKALKARKDINVRELAALTFTCEQCWTTLQYPMVLGHSCLYQIYSASPTMPNQDCGAVGETLYAEIAKEKCESFPWSCKMIRPTKWNDRVQNLFEVCGQDPRRASLEDLDKQDARVFCNMCRRRRGRLVMTWRAAFNHCHSHHKRAEPSSVTWSLVTGEEEKQARELEESCMDKAILKYEKEPHWTCLGCPYVASKGDVIAHNFAEHEISPGDVVEGKDYHRMIGSPPFAIKPVVVYPKRISNRGE